MTAIATSGKRAPVRAAVREAARDLVRRAPPLRDRDARGPAPVVRDFRGEEEVRPPEGDRVCADEPPVRDLWAGPVFRLLREAPRCDVVLLVMRAYVLEEGPLAVLKTPARPPGVGRPSRPADILASASGSVDLYVR